MLFAAFIIQLPLVILLSISSYPTKGNEFLENGKATLILGEGPSENGKWPVALNEDLKNPIALCWVLLFLLYNSALYLIIFYCAAKIRKAISEQMAHMEISARSGELNGQITRTLLIQAILPAFPLLISSLAVISIFFSSDLMGTIVLTLQMIVTIPLSWVPMLNPFKNSLIEDSKTKVKIIHVANVNRMVKLWHGNERRSTHPITAPPRLK
uniref:ABC transmembrane type-1 domain-containing protein n=1 Tax=Meloidogyne hapla TaxID=6305 RepID=A0A1I8B0M4_MELHA